MARCRNPAEDADAWDAACCWAFRRTFRHKPAADELRDYQRALAERDHLGLADALPIYARLRGEAGAAPAKAVRPKRRPNVSPAAPPPRAKERAEALVREQLGNGPAPGECVIAAAAEADISERNLIAAADELGVRTQRGVWWLPGR
jgi:hypothetical protein